MTHRATKKAENMDDIDVAQQIAELGEEALIAAAEAYFARIESPEYHLRKPFTGFFETPSLLQHLAATISLLEGFEGVRILDFGAGTCWMSRLLAQLGASVTATDVSPSALRLGQDLLRTHPLIGGSGSLDFVVFDGTTLEFPTGSFDRIVVSDAWHHVVDQDGALTEFSRVLVKNGTVVISDVGPQHSRTAQSQFEMRNFRVIEQDTDTDDLKRRAHEAGFRTVEAFIYAPTPLAIVSDSLEAGYSLDDARLTASAKAFHADHRLVRLRRQDASVLDSRQPVGLQASIEATFDARSRSLEVRVENTGGAVWLTDSQLSVGRVNIGLHLTRSDVMVDLDFQRIALDGPIAPGESRTITTSLENDIHGDVIVDLVSEGVAWFEALGSTPVHIHLD